MTDCSLDAACSGLVFLRDRRVEDLGDAVDNVGVLDCQEDRGAEILISLDMCGNSFAVFFTGFIALFIGVNS